MNPLVDYFSLYLFALKYAVIFVACVITLSGIDDLFIDVMHWGRSIWRNLTIFRRKSRSDQSILFGIPEKPLAIMVPAWHETGVIGPMADNAGRTIVYENYHIFVGTYPNDPDTQRDVDEICARFPNVHKVVCARPGPTSKADCLNNVLDAIKQFERRANFEFAGFILHDAEDVVSPLELRLFNYLVDRKDLIQVPVYPFERKWYDFTGMHYIDEFTELHTKDVPLREALVGQVPSAGVGTCFSRRAIDTLLVDGDGIAFDTQSLTEDYDIGFRLKERGLKEIFVRFPVLDLPKSEWKATRVMGQSFRESNVICVREFFPNKIETAVRQKSRWIIGIVFQGYVTHRWTKSWLMNYFLWRDRKGVLTNFFSFAANLILFQIFLLWLYEVLWPDAYRFLSVFEQSELLVVLLWINAVLMLNRAVQRAVFVTQFYGLIQGLLSLPRMFLGNYINFLANWRAIKQIIQHGSPRRVAWDKTTHDFPLIGEISRTRRMIGQILVQRGIMSETEIINALEQKPPGMRLGTWLVHSERISPWQLAECLGEQATTVVESLNPSQVPDNILALVPASIALHYAIFPIRLEDDCLVVATETMLSPVALSALRRKTGMNVRCVIALIGQVTVGLRQKYSRYPQADPMADLISAVEQGRVSQKETELIWTYFVSRQIMLGEVLQTLGHIDAAAFSAILLQHSSTDLRLGDFLVRQDIIAKETLDQAIDLQMNIQPDIETAIVHFQSH